MNQLPLYISILPSVLLGFYIYRKDGVEKEPISLLLRSFIGGLIAGILVIILSIILKVNSITLDTVPNILFYSFVAVSLLEEGMKFILTYLICYRNKEFNYYYDGIIYSSFTSLGFATLENALYLYNSTNFFTAILRGIITVPSHIFFAIFMGYYLGSAKHYKIRRNKRKELEYLIKALVIPIVLHGFFDYCLFSNSTTSIIFFIIFITILYISAFKKVKDVSSTDQHI